MEKRGIRNHDTNPKARRPELKTKRQLLPEREKKKEIMGRKEKAAGPRG